MSGLIKVVRGGAKGAPKKVPTFFSRVDEAAKELPRTKGTGKEFMAELKKQPGVKKAELDDRKLSELESAPKMTKEEFIQKLEQKPAPKIEESIKANPTDADLNEMAMKLIDDKADEITGRKFGKRDRFNYYDWDDHKEGVIQYLKEYDYDKYLREAKRNIEENVGADFPKYEEWKLPGGENYREILLKLPEPIEAKIFRDLELRVNAGERLKPEELQKYHDLVDAKAFKGQFHGTHWDEPNVLAHIRVSDRKGPNGEKILHVEEIQSDWHQAARDLREEKIKEIMMFKHVDKKTASEMVPADYGYLIDKSIKELPSNYVVQENQFTKNPQHKYEVFNKDTGLVYGFSGATPEEAIEKTLASMNKHQYENVEGKVPDAPFKKNWHELATKRIMDYAIQNGYDKVAITPGAEQASRYSLSKSIDEINVTSRTHAGTGEVSKSVALDTKDGKSLRFGVSNDGKIDNVNDASLTNFMGKSLDEVIGKDMAKKILEGGTQTISGEGLTVGGEGMIGFYDQILPAYINKEYGKYGANIGTMPIIKKPKSIERAGKSFYETPEETVDVHSIDITPEMRETIQSKGQPLYQATGIGLTGAAAAPSEEKVQVSDNPDTMMLELQDQGFAGGGLLKKAAKAIKGMQEVLPAAEREANKAKMLESSAIKQRMYHGSASPKIEQFKTGKMKKEEYYPGNTIEPWAIDNRDAVFLTPEPNFSSKYSGGEWEVNSGWSPTTYPVYVQARNPWDYDNPEHIESAIKAYKEKYPLKRDKSGGVPSDESMRHRHFENNLRELPLREISNWSGIENAALQEIIKDIGHDSFFVKESGVKNLGVYDPKTIKSAIGNRGTYDVTDPDINKALGGLARAKRK